MDVPIDVLVVIAHPDDELFVSGTMCLCAEHGFRIGLVCVTDGEGGSRKILRERDGPDRLAAIRCMELTLSAGALGVEWLRFLRCEDIPPDQWSENRKWDEAAVVDALADLVREASPQLILVHGPLGGYGHPAHRHVGVNLLRAADRVGFAGSIFSFAAQVRGAFFSWRFDQPSNVLVDARGFLGRRCIALSYHQSEAQFFLSPYLPKTPRQFASAAFGFLASFAEAGRKRLPIATARRFFKRFPFEGLALQRRPAQGAHFFAAHFAGDRRVRFEDQ